MRMYDSYLYCIHFWNCVVNSYVISTRRAPNRSVAFCLRSASQLIRILALVPFICLMVRSSSICMIFSPFNFTILLPDEFLTRISCFFLSFKKKRMIVFPHSSCSAHRRPAQLNFTFVWSMSAICSQLFVILASLGLVQHANHHNARLAWS